MKTILAIGTHPDDIEIGCGGTIAASVARGDAVTFLIATSGEEGGDPQLREGEALESAEILGVEKVIFLRYPDGLTHFTKEQKLELIAHIRALRPDLIFTHARSDTFPDHQVVHQLTMAAVLGAAGPWYPAASGDPHRVPEIFGYEVWNPIPDAPLVTKIDETLELKLRALAVHRSQTADVAYLNAVKGLAMYRGAISMKGQYAEAFEVLRMSF